MKGISPLLWILIGQVFTVFVLLIWIVFHRAALYIKGKIDKKRKAKLSDYFFNILSAHASFSLQSYPGRKGWAKNLLEVLELFSKRVEGEEWLALCREIAEPLLINQARAWARSIFWARRNFAARVFAMTYFPKDEEEILRLMDDAVFLVQAPATFAAIRLENRQAIEKMLVRMSQEQGFAIFFYRDALLQSSKAAILLVVELAALPQLHLSALDVLSGKSWTVPIPFLEEDLHSKDPQTLLAALRALFRNPLSASLPYFVRSLSHPLPEIRLAAMKGFELFPTEETWHLLEDMLSDPVWFVRIEAAKMLKKRGERGLEILNKQKAGPALEAAKYAALFS